MIEQVNARQNMKVGKHGTTNLREFQRAMAKPAFHQTSYHIAPTNGVHLLVANNKVNQSVMNVEKGYVWAQVPCAVDSGACAHVSPPGIFGSTEQ